MRKACVIARQQVYNAKPAYCSNNDDYMLQQTLHVCGTSLVVPGCLDLNITEGRCDGQTLETSHHSVNPDFSEPSDRPWSKLS